jgi:hypothetical protein
MKHVLQSKGKKPLDHDPKKIGQEKHEHLHTHTPPIWAFISVYCIHNIAKLFPHPHQ